MRAQQALESVLEIISTLEQLDYTQSGTTIPGREFGHNLFIVPCVLDRFDHPVEPEIGTDRVHSRPLTGCCPNREPRKPGSRAKYS